MNRASRQTYYGGWLVVSVWWRGALVVGSGKVLLLLFLLLACCVKCTLSYWCKTTSINEDSYRGWNFQVIKLKILQTVICMSSQIKVVGNVLSELSQLWERQAQVYKVSLVYPAWSRERCLAKERNKTLSSNFCSWSYQRGQNAVFLEENQKCFNWSPLDIFFYLLSVNGDEWGTDLWPIFQFILHLNWISQRGPFKLEMCVNLTGSVCGLRCEQGWCWRRCLCVMTGMAWAVACLGRNTHLTSQFTCTLSSSCTNYIRIGQPM